MKAPSVESVARCIFPGGKAVLAAYGPDDEFLLGIGCNPKSVASWARCGSTAADRRRMVREVAEHYGS